MCMTGFQQWGARLRWQWLLRWQSRYSISRIPFSLILSLFLLLWLHLKFVMLFASLLISLCSVFYHLFFLFHWSCVNCVTFLLCDLSDHALVTILVWISMSPCCLQPHHHRLCLSSWLRGPLSALSLQDGFLSSRCSASSCHYLSLLSSK